MGLKLINNNSYYFSDLEDICKNGGEHYFKQFTYLGIKSDFENVCGKCGGYTVDKQNIPMEFGTYSDYLNSDRYFALKKEGEIIKRENEMDQGKNLQVFGNRQVCL